MSLQTDKRPLRVADIRRLVSWLSASRVGSIEIGDDTCLVRIVMGGKPRLVEAAASDVAATSTATETALATAGQSHVAPPAVPALREVRAPGPGIFLVRHPAARTDFCAVGAHVSSGSCVGLVQAGVALLPVRPAFSGAVQQTFVANGDRVEWGTLLFHVTEQPASSTSRSNT